MLNVLSLPEIEVFAVLASSGLCPALPGPDIIVSIQHHDAEVRNDLTSAQLQELRGDMDVAHQTPDGDHAKILGLLHGDIAIKYRINFAKVPQSSGSGACLRYDRIHVVLELAPVIFVARDYAPQHCLYREIFQHEEAHLAVDRRVMDKYAQRLRDGLMMAFSMPGDGVAGPVADDAMVAFQEDMGRAVMGMADVVVQDMAQERVERQAAVDSPEHYARVMRRCSFKVAGY